jgi:L-Ala-D/L-Glu epimerase
MKLTSVTVYALRIPLVEAFRHHTAGRTLADSVVVRVQADNGAVGYGEGAPRAYVTGETAEWVSEHVVQSLWPAIAERDLPALEDPESLGAIDALIPERAATPVLADHASRAALELAIVDCLLRGPGWSAARVLPPRRRRVVYSGVIGAGSVEQARARARQLKIVGFPHVKVKVGFDDDVARVRAIREVLGADVSLRVDANGAWSPDQAGEVLMGIAPLGVVAAEQPLPRGPVAEWQRLRATSPVPLVADESLVTPADADALIAAQAVDYFNIRVSKCGGLARSLALAGRATRAGIRVQVGAQVGETAILAAAGRHLAAALPEVTFVEGSFGSLLLTEDVTAESVRFGHRGEAPVLTGLGLGVSVLEDRLRKYASRMIVVQDGRTRR